MVVRFLPSGEGAAVEPAVDRGELAEVIELRSRLNYSPSGDRDAAGETVPVSALPALATVSTLRPVAEAAAKIPDAFEAQISGVSPKRLLEAAEELAEEPVEAIRRASSASEDAVRLLARKARSSGELRHELLALGHSADEAEAAVLECESSLYLDDLGLARMLTEGLRTRKRASRSQIRMKLRERLLPLGIIEEALGELDDDEEYELLREAASERARRLSELDRQTAERRLLGFLARRGWSGEKAVRVAREALDNTAARGTVRFR